MSTPVQMIEERAGVEAAASKMLAKGVSALVVSPRDEEAPYGIVTTSDIAAAYGRSIPGDWAQVADVMSTPLLLVTPTVPAVYVARLMDRASVRHVAVFNGREVVGVISTRDFLKVVAPAVQVAAV
jgi:CBS domain-containing protein